MKALLTIVFTGFALFVMAQGPGDGNRTVTFDSPEPTVKVVAPTGTATTTAARVVFTGTEPQVKQEENTNNPATNKPRVEFTSPNPQNVSNKAKDE